MNLPGLLRALLLCLVAGAVCAGEWHIGGSLRCGDCHLQHASDKGQPLPGGPYSTLLKNTTVNELCLSCHDGTDPTAPDVLAPVIMYSGTPAGQSGGGAFEPPGAISSHGHTLDQSAATPLSSGGLPISLTCASCHAVHGNGNFRNLLEDPAGIGETNLLALGTDVFREFAPDDPPTASGSVAAYQAENVAYVSGFASWCSSCHDQLRAMPLGGLPAHFSAHPSDVPLNLYSPQNHTDPQHWIAGSGAGFAVGSLPGAGVRRVPHESPTATDLVSARTVRASDEVFCLSCHGAHGTGFGKALRWPYVEGGPAYIAGCQQCHNR